MGVKPPAPLDHRNLWISGGFQAPTVCLAPLGRKNGSPPGPISDYVPEYTVFPHGDLYNSES